MSIILKKVSKSFYGNEIIKDFSIELLEGETVCLFGPSGCGKTTLLNIISGITKQDSGGVYGLDNRNISFVFQEDRLIPYVNICDNIAIAIKNKSGDMNAFDYLDLVGLRNEHNKFPQEISGGMKSLASIARALAYDGDIFILDEPFRAIDINSKARIIDIIKKKLRGKLSIFVTHDIDEAIKLSDKILILSGPPLEIKETIIVNDYKENYLKNYIQDKIKTPSL